MSIEEENKAIFSRWFGEAWNKGNFDVAREIIAPAMRVHGAGGQPVEAGPEGLIALIKAWRDAFPDGQMSVDSLIAEGDLVAALLTWRGTHRGNFYGIPATGKPVVCTSIGIDRIANGQIVDGWGELDMVGLMQQMGAFPMVGPGVAATGRPPEWGPNSPVPPDPRLSPEENKARMLRFIEIHNEPDLSPLREIVDMANYVEHNPVWGAHDVESSRESYEQLRRAMPDLTFTVDSGLVIAEGDKVAFHATIQGRHTGEPLFGVAPSRRQLTWTESDVGRFANGRLVERWVCADTLSLMQQLGVVPGPGEG